MKRVYNKNGQFFKNVTRKDRSQAKLSGLMDPMKIIEIAYFIGFLSILQVKERFFKKVMVLTTTGYVLDLFHSKSPMSKLKKFLIKKA